MVDHINNDKVQKIKNLPATSSERQKICAEFGIPDSYVNGRINDSYGKFMNFMLLFLDELTPPKYRKTAFYEDYYMGTLKPNCKLEKFPTPRKHLLQVNF